MENQINNEIDSENNNNLEFQITYSKIISIAWMTMFVVATLFLITGLVLYFGAWFNTPTTWYSWPISYILGAMVNFFAFNLLKNNIAGLTSESKRVGSSANYIIRFAIYGFILYIAYMNSIFNEFSENPKLNPFIVASGFLTVKVAIYIYTFSRKNEK